jgi:hypothetical protein
MAPGVGTSWMRMGAILAQMSLMPFVLVSLFPARVGSCGNGPPAGWGLAFQLAVLLLVSGMACLFVGGLGAPEGTQRGWWLRFGVAALAMFLLAPLAGV